MFTLFLTILFASWPLLFLSAHAQTTNVTSADGIRASDGTCLTASSAADNSAVTLEPCDRDSGQKWDISTSGPHIRDQGFAIIILSGTDACLDVAAINNSHPGLYSCGGLPGGVGNASVNQAFTYSTFRNSRGPLVFVPLEGWVNNGVGPNQTCLSASQGKLDAVHCDPASPAPEQQFYIGFNSTPTSATPAPASATASRSSAKRSVNAVAIAVPLVVVALLSVLGFFLIRRWRSARKKATDEKVEARAPRPFLSPSTAFTPSTHTQTSGGTKAGLPSISNISTSQPVESSGIVSANSAGYTSSPQNNAQQDTGMQPADVDHIVSMVAARIDPSPPQDRKDLNITLSQTDSDAASSRHALSPDELAPSTRTVSPSDAIPAGQANNVNIDTILTMLAARVDPSYRDQTDVRGSRDVPPSYQVPPSYHG